MMPTNSDIAAASVMSDPRARRPALRNCGMNPQRPSLRHILAALWLALIASPLVAQVPDFRQVFDRHGVVMLLIDPTSGQIVDANPAAADFYGRGRDVLKAMRIEQINTFSAGQVAAERALAEKENRNYFIFRHRLANDEVRTVEVYSHPFDFDGRRLLLSMIHDISPGRDRDQGLWHYQERLEALVAARTAEADARSRTVLVLMAGLLIASALTLALVVAIRRLKRAQAEQSRSEAHYRRLFESNPHPMWVYELETLRFLAVNDAASSHYGYSRDEFLSMTIKDIRPPEDLPRLYRNLEALSTEGLDQAGVWRHLKRDGSVIDVEITSHVLEFEGRKSELVLAHDITIRRQAENALRESEERFRATFEQAAVGVAHVSPEGRWLRVNQKLCDIVGYCREDLLSKTFHDITHPDDLDADLEYVRQMLAGEIKTYSIEKRYIRLDGSVVWINLTVALIRGDSGQPNYFISVVEDISERKRIHSELQQKLAELQQWYEAMLDREARVIELKREANALARDLGRPPPYELSFVDSPGGKTTP